MSTSVGPRDEAFVPLTILVPVDGSALSERSVPLAQQLTHGSTLACAPSPSVATGTKSLPTSSWTATLPAPCSTISPSSTGPWSACPATYMAESDARLIGSVAEQLIRHAPIPVIVTGPQVGRAEVGVPRTLLAGSRTAPAGRSCSSCWLPGHRCSTRA